mgnify:CR=1 FL=1
MKKLKHIIQIKPKKIIFQLIWQDKILYSKILLKNNKINFLTFSRKYLQYLIESGFIK